MPTRSPPSPHHALPRTAAAILRALIPRAEREEVLGDLAAEYDERWRGEGAGAARRWIWRQVSGSVPALLRRGWWRGWTGFEPRANHMKPGGPMFESWIGDLRFAARRLRSRPTYALLAVLTLALGVGGTAAIYGVARGLLFDPLPFEREQELGKFWMDYSWSEQEFLGMRGEFPGFRMVASYRPEDLTMQLAKSPARLLPGIAASGELFTVLGARPVIGRALQVGDDVPGAEPVAVLSYGLWQELGGAPSIIGSRLTLDGRARTVVGVMPRGFWFPDPSVRVWTPVQLDARRRSGNYSFVGRVSAGQDPARMQAPLAQLYKLLGERFQYQPGKWDKRKDGSITPLREAMVGGLRPALLATLGAMGVILLIACANVAALMLGQLNARSSEMAVRSALGAHRSRLVQQLMIESLLVGAAAGVLGAAIGAGAFRVLVRALPLGAWGESASLDWRVFATSLAIALTASLLVALVPTLSLVRGDLRGVMGTSRTGGISGRRGRMESTLVVAEVALAVLMASGAALLVRSVQHLYDIHVGVDTRGLAVLDVVTSGNLTVQQRSQQMVELVRELSSMPGVKSAAATQKLPLRGNGNNNGLAIEGAPALPGTTTYFRMVSRGYFETLGVPTLDGRTFDASDRADGETAVVVNAAFVKQFMPGVNPIGRRVNSMGDSWARIVGVVGDVAEGQLTDAMAPARYYLDEQAPWGNEGYAIVMRARSGDPTQLLDAARRTVQRIAPSVAVQEATTMQRVVDLAVGPARQVMTLLTLLTGLALVLGAVGIYGVIAHFATRRKRDWAIQMALGLRASKVVSRVVSHGVALVAAGIVIGMIGVALLTRLLASLLYNVSAVDPISLAAASVALLAVGVIAAFLPARRAGLVDPATVLREQ